AANFAETPSALAIYEIFLSFPFRDQAGNRSAFGWIQLDVIIISFQEDGPVLVSSDCGAFGFGGCGFFSVVSAKAQTRGVGKKDQVPGARAMINDLRQCLRAGRIAHFDWPGPIWRQRDRCHTRSSGGQRVEHSDSRCPTRARGLRERLSRLAD